MQDRVQAAFQSLHSAQRRPYTYMPYPLVRPTCACPTHSKAARAAFQRAPTRPRCVRISRIAEARCQHLNPRRQAERRAWISRVRSRKIARWQYMRLHFVHAQCVCGGPYRCLVCLLGSGSSSCHQIAFSVLLPHHLAPCTVSTPRTPAALSTLAA